MRKTFLAATLLAGMFLLFAPAPTCASVAWSVSISSFHETLAPYGRWVVAGSYGEVWVPGGIAAGWQPYWDGEWIWTDYGWTWVSYDPWGDVPCHYGTWAWADPYGWVWEPGLAWAPAWVTWAWTDDYIGWAPVPATFGITVNGYAGPPVVAASTRYVFVPAGQFAGVNAQTVRVPSTQNTVILRSAQKATRFTVSGGIVRTAGPPPKFVQRVSGKPIERVSIEKAKTRPTTLAAAHVSAAKQIRVVAPARERAAAMASAKTRENKAGRSKPAGAASLARQRPSRVKAHEARANPSLQTKPARQAHAVKQPSYAKMRGAKKPTRESQVAEQPPSPAKAHEARAKPMKQAARQATRSTRQARATGARASSALRSTAAKRREPGTLARTHVKSHPPETGARIHKETARTVPSVEKATPEKAAAHPIAPPSKQAEPPASLPREEHRVARAALPQERPASPAAGSPHGAPTGQAAKPPAPRPPQSAPKQKEKEKGRE